MRWEGCHRGVQAIGVSSEKQLLHHRLVRTTLANRFQIASRRTGSGRIHQVMGSAFVSVGCPCSCSLILVKVLEGRLRLEVEIGNLKYSEGFLYDLFAVHP